MSNLECRIEALEKANRRWRYMAGLLALLPLIALTVAAKLPDKVPDLLQAKRIEVLAPDGKTAIILKADSDGSSLRLTSRGPAHKRVIALEAHTEGVDLMLMKHAEAPLLSAKVDDNGSSLFLFDGREPSQNPRSVVLRSACSTEFLEGGTAICLTSSQRKQDIQAGLFMQEAPVGSSLLLGGSKGKIVIVRANQDNGKVNVVSPSNNAIWTFP
jgi:hypothetical protein